MAGRRQRDETGSRLALRRAFPESKAYSPRNLTCVRAFAAAWPERAIVQVALARVPWYHQLALLEKLVDSAEGPWYARQALAHGWSHNILVLQIDLLFYHLKLRCYVLVELKAVPFDPAFVGLAGFVLANGSKSSNQSDEGEIRKQSHVLTPGRYVGAEAAEDAGEPFAERLVRLRRQFEAQIRESLAMLAGGTGRGYE